MENSRFQDHSLQVWTESQKSGNGRYSGFDGQPKEADSCSKLMGCLGRIPYPSLIATILTVVGTAVFCGCFYRAIGITVSMLNEAFNLQEQIDWMRTVQLFVIIVSAVMGGLAFILLIVGFLATGATRRKVYTGFKSRLGGRITAAFLLIISEVLAIIWVLVDCILVVPCVFFILIMSLCGIDFITKMDGRQNCFNVTHVGFRLPRRFKDEICGVELTNFCTSAQEAGPLYIAAFVGCLVLVIGLIHFMCCLSANYAHIKDGIKLRKYEDAAKFPTDETEFSTLTKGGNSKTTY